MSFDISALSTYIDDTKFGLLTQLQSTSGLAGVVRMMPGIKSASNVHFLSTDVTFQDDGCSYNSADTTPMTEKSLPVGAIAVMESICVKTLNGTWLETQVRAGANGEEAIPEMVATAWTEKKMNRLARAIAIADFQGDLLSGSANLDKYDGLLVQVDADVTVVDGNTGGVTVATGVTAANIVAILQAMWLARPEELKGKENNSLWLSQEFYDLYIIALINADLFNYKGEDGETKLFGTDITIRPTVGLNGTDRMILMNDENCVVGLDAEGDSDQLKVWYSEDSRINKSLVAFKRGLTYGYGNEIVEFTLVP